jgi:hypothetical protein
LIAVFSAIWAGAFLADIAERFRRPAWSTLTYAGIVMAIGLPSTLKPMHQNRAGHLDAGRWLAQRITAEQDVVDPYAWARYYSGHAFVSSDFDPSRACFVVLEQSDNDHSRLGTLPLARDLANRGRCVFRTQGTKSVVEVYRVD